MDPATRPETIILRVETDVLNPRSLRPASSPMPPDVVDTLYNLQNQVAAADSATHEFLATLVAARKQHDVHTTELEDAEEYLGFIRRDLDASSERLATLEEDFQAQVQRATAVRREATESFAKWGLRVGELGAGSGRFAVAAESAEAEEGGEGDAEEVAPLEVEETPQATGEVAPLEVEDTPQATGEVAPLEVEDTPQATGEVAPLEVEDTPQATGEVVANGEDSLEAAVNGEANEEANGEANVESHEDE